MGLFGKSKKERETEYMSRLDVPSCLKEDFELIIDDIFTIMGVGTVATGNILTGMCREGENACIYKANGDILETRITTVDVHTKERKANGCGFKFIGGMKFGEPSADGRGSAPPELAEQQARAGSEAAPATPPL